MESSIRDLLNDMAEHRPVFKNNQNTSHPRFGFTPKTGREFPKTFFFTVIRKTEYPSGGVFERSSGRKRRDSGARHQAPLA